MAPELSEIWDQSDDWTGVASSEERRRRQNRLHQRAYHHPSNEGAKKRLEKFPNAQHNDSDPDPERRRPLMAAGSSVCILPAEKNSTSSHQHQTQLFMNILDQLPILVLVRCTGLHEKVRDALQRLFTNWGLHVYMTRDLPLVTRLTAFDALARNALMLRIPLEYLETDEHASVFNHQGPPPPSQQQLSIPTHLRPTNLQRTVTHYSWLDLFPIPGMRDNILRGIAAGIYDEDELCEALCCDLLNLDGGTTALLVVWGESWDAKGWELSPEFFAKWGVLLQGCTEVLETTNYWRQKRGATRLHYTL